MVEHACGLASLQTGEFVPNVSNGVDSYRFREPLGVCAGICPFDFPAVIPLWVSLLFFHFCLFSVSLVHTIPIPSIAACLVRWLGICLWDTVVVQITSHLLSNIKLSACRCFLLQSLAVILLFLSHQRWIQVIILSFKSENEEYLGLRTFLIIYIHFESPLHPVPGPWG